MMWYDIWYDMTWYDIYDIWYGIILGHWNILGEKERGRQQTIIISINIYCNILSDINYRYLLSPREKTTGQ